jgi:D-alanine-D-alanine ligase
MYEMSVAELVAHERPFEIELAPRTAPRWPDPKQAFDDWSAQRLTLFLALHGVMAEDGVLQGWLEAHGIPFTGSGSAASRDAFDKTRARTIVKAHGLRTAEAVVIEPNDVPKAAARAFELLERFRRLVVKPVADGSSIGLRFVDDAAGLDEAMLGVKDEGVPYLAEAFVTGRELTVGVIDDDAAGLCALPCSEVRIERAEAFDYAAKYLGRGVREITPAEIPVELAAEAQRVALVAHRALGCEGYSRTDLIVDRDGPVYLETNTLPGLTGASFIPQQLAAAGIPFERFLERQLELARRRASSR